MEIVERKQTKQPKAKREKGESGGFKTMFTKRRKIMILGGMFALLLVTGYLNFALNTAGAADVNTQVNTNLFTMFKTTRADERARDILIYENMAGNANYSATAQASAEQRLLEIRENVAFETAAEGLVMTEGYADAIVNRSNGFVNVLLKKDSNITSVQAVKIMSILQSITPSLDIDNVFISIMQ